MSLKLYKNQLSRITFSVLNETGKFVEQLTNVQVNLYSVKTNSVVYSQTYNSLDLDPTTNTFEFDFTPPNTLEAGSYYFKIQGKDEDNFDRHAIVFVDILDTSSVTNYIPVHIIAKYVNDVNPDYSLLPLFIHSAITFIESYIGQKIIPAVYESYYYSSSEEIKVLLEATPLLEIIEVKDRSGVDLGYEILDKRIGLVLVSNGGKEFSIKYKAGWGSIPDLIISCVGLLVGLMYDKMKYQSFERMNIGGLITQIDNKALENILKMLMPFVKHV